MLNKFIVAIFLSLICNAFASDSHYSPVLMFKHKENTKSYEKSAISATTQVNQRDFEQQINSLDAEQKVMFFVIPDLSPEDLALKNDEHVKAFQNIANGVDMVDYMLFVENAVDNKVTQGENVAHTSVSTINELEPEPSTDKKIIIAKLPGYHVSESKFHLLSRIDRAVYAVSQLPQYKDYLFVLTSESNSHMGKQQEHSRRRRAAGLEPPFKHSDANVLFFARNYTQKTKTQGEKPVQIDSITAAKNGDSITISINSPTIPLSLQFDYSPVIEYWQLNAAQSKIKDQSLEDKATEIAATTGFSYSCSSTAFFSLNDTEILGVYFTGLQIQFDFSDSTEPITKFSESFDCIGFSSIPIWTGILITFLLLGIVAVGISYIMDIRAMDRFDDPKGKTITVTASE